MATFVFLYQYILIILSISIITTNGQPCQVGSGDCNACTNQTQCNQASNTTIAECNWVDHQGGANICQRIQPNCESTECNTNNKCRCSQAANSAEEICCGSVPSPPLNSMTTCKWTSTCKFRDDTPTTAQPTTTNPTTAQPTTANPTTANPTTTNPTKATLRPTAEPTREPTTRPSDSPTGAPTTGPTNYPTTTARPTTAQPTTANPTPPPVDTKNQWTIACPCGLISMWYGSDDFPAGYALCDGTNGTPDLRGKFIIGSDGTGGDFPPCDGDDCPDSMGGSNQITIQVNNLPVHKHGVGTIDVDGDGGHDHSIEGDAHSAGSQHSHGLGSALISHEDQHTHGIPALTTNIATGEHGHDVEGATTETPNATHTHGINFASQSEDAHTHTIPQHTTSGAADDGEHDHFIIAYQDTVSVAPVIGGVSFESIGAKPAAGHQIHTDPNDATNDGAHDHIIPSQTTDSNSGHVHDIIGDTTGGDGDHDHNIEGATTGANDGRHGHLTHPHTTHSNSGHDHTISGNTNNDGEHGHHVVGGTTTDGGHGHGIVGHTGNTGNNEAIEYYPPYTALRFICCIRAGTTR